MYTSVSVRLKLRRSIDFFKQHKGCFTWKADDGQFSKTGPENKDPVGLPDMEWQTREGEWWGRERREQYQRKQKGQFGFGRRHHQWSSGRRLFSHYKSPTYMRREDLGDSLCGYVSFQGFIHDSCWQLLCVYDSGVFFCLFFLAELRLKMHVESVRDEGASVGRISHSVCEEPVIFRWCTRFLYVKIVSFTSSWGNYLF